MRAARAPLAAPLLAAGACAAALELAAGRLVAARYGGALPAWTAVITATLAGLGLGYAWGGRLAGRETPAALPGRLLAGAGAGLALAALGHGRALDAAEPLGPGAGALAAACALLLPGLLPLGALSPVAARLAASGREEAGRRAGDAWAAPSAGGVLGAAAAGFLLLPALGPERLLWGGAALLLALAALGEGPRGPRAGALAAGALCLLAAAAPRPAADALWDRHSPYGRVRVWDEGGVRRLSVNGAVQSEMTLATGESASSYILRMEWVRGLRPAGSRGLALGLGAGLLPKGLERRGWTVDAVELDPGVAEAAAACFGYAPAGRVAVGDGRAWLAATRREWDALLVDAYGGEALPAHLFTAEAFALMRARLAPGGVLALNLAGAAEGPDGRAWKAVHRTLASTFREVRAFGSPGPSGLANVLLFASDGPLAAPAPRGPAVVREAVEAMLREELPPPSPSDAPLLEDDWNPLDLLHAGSARRSRRRMLESGRLRPRG